MATGFELAGKAIDKLLAKAEAAAADKRRRMASGVGAAAVALSRRCFTRAASPYGTPWRRLALPGRKRGGASAKPLLDTGALRRSISHRARVGGVEVGAGVKYAGFHQFGTRRIPRRAFLPNTGASGRLPRSWRQEFERAALVALRRGLR